MALNEKNYNIDYYLEMIEHLEGDTKAIYMNAYKKYMDAQALRNKGVDLREAEKKIFNMDRYSSTDGVVDTLNDYYAALRDTGEDTKSIDNLMAYINSVSETAISNATKINLIRHSVAEFGIIHNLDCYLFDANEEVFDDYYNRIILSETKGRSL